MRTLYHTIDILLTPNEMLHNSSILVDDTNIAAVGKAAEQEPTDLKVDCSGKLAMPALKNGHAHSAMTLLRGFADDMKLYPWLNEKIWPTEAKLTGEDVYHGVRLACLEMIKSGTIFCNDMYFFLPEAWRAYREMGIKAAVGSAIIDFSDPKKAEEARRQILEEVDRFGPKGNEADERKRVSLAIAPHAIYTVGADTLQWCAERAKQENIPFHIHLAESEKEVADCLAQTGKRPVAYLDELGVLDTNCIAAHGIWVDEEDLDILAARGVTMVHNPASNMKTSAGSCFPYQEYRRRGIPLMIGTDGCASNNALDLFSDGRLAGLLQKHHFGDPTLLPAEEIVALITGGSATHDEKIGPFGNLGAEIRAGAPADIIFLDLTAPRMAPLHNPISNIAYAADGACVDTVMCDGSVLMAGGKVPGEEAIVAAAAEAATALVGRN
jgi:5-methylthioadenosine/S-adenosylhomocysteine deaminase